MRWIALVLTVAMGMAGDVVSAAEEVDLELVILADASRSIDNAEIRFQRQGYADAVTHPDVLGAIEQGLQTKKSPSPMSSGAIAHPRTSSFPGRSLTAATRLELSPKLCSMPPAAPMGRTPSATHWPRRRR